jgi:hypothetical protein
MGYNKGGRPKEDKPRDIEIKFRVNKEEFESIQQLVDKSSEITRAEFIRNCVLNPKKVTKTPSKDVLALKIAVDKIGVNINQVTRKLNSGTSTHDYFLKKEVSDIREALLRLEDKL